MGKKNPISPPPQMCDSFFRDILENCNDLVLSISPEGKILYANRAWKELLGYSEKDLETIQIMDIIAPDCLGECMKKFQAILEGKDIGKIETLFMKKDGNKVLVEGNCNCMFEQGRPLYVRSIFRDITERKAMEKRLLQAQNLEAIGLLAGGIAHDFNNLLTCIMGLLSVSKIYISPKDPVFEIIEKCEDTCLQGKVLTSKFLTFASGGEPIKKRVPTPYFFETLIEKIANRLQICAECHLPKGLWDVAIDKDQFEVVLENVLKNAKEAIESQGRDGKDTVVNVIGENVEVHTGQGQIGSPKGEYVKITLRDNGPGIPEEELSKIFEPYYSTKRQTNEKGIGFGLAIAYSVLRRHGGFITAESSLGEGTSIHIFIPRATNCNINCQ